MTFLIDTHVLSEGMKRSPDQRVLQWLGENGEVGMSAVAYGLTLATRNTRDFAGCGIALHNPFD